MNELYVWKSPVYWIYSHTECFYMNLAADLLCLVYGVWAVSSTRLLLGCRLTSLTVIGFSCVSLDKYMYMPHVLTVENARLNSASFLFDDFTILLFTLCFTALNSYSDSYSDNRKSVKEAFLSVHKTLIQYFTALSLISKSTICENQPV